MGGHYRIEEVSRLAPSDEVHWQRLRRQVEWANGFWLGFLFCQSPQVAATIRERVERLLRNRIQAASGTSS